jgi:hypothetical protein
VSAKSGKERQAEFRKRMTKAGKVRVGFLATKAQREKLRQLGGSAWLLRKIDAAKVKADDVAPKQ